MIGEHPAAASNGRHKVGLSKATRLVVTVARLGALLGAIEALGPRQLALAEVSAGAEGRLRATEIAIVDLTSRQVSVGLHPGLSASLEALFEEATAYHSLGECQRAAVIYLHVFESAPTAELKAAATFRLAECALELDNLASARQHYRTIVERGGEPAYREHLLRATERLVELEINANDLDAANSALEAGMTALPADARPVLTYHQAKVLYSRARGAGARPIADAKTEANRVNAGLLRQSLQAFRRVPPDSERYPMALYFSGVVQLALGDLEGALRTYRGLIETIKPSEEASVEAMEALADTRDLAALAMGRLLFEMRRVDEAIAAYQLIPRTSPRLDEALYEIAWIYVEKGDLWRAERSLETLVLIDPDSRYADEARLFLGEVLLRGGAYQRATRHYQRVERQEVPTYRSLRRLAAEAEDIDAFFHALLVTNEDVIATADPWPESMEGWLARDERFQEVVATRQELRSIHRMVSEMEMLLRLTRQASEPSLAVEMFQDTRRLASYAYVLLNQLANRRLDIAEDASSKRGDEAWRQMQAKVRALPQTMRAYELRFATARDSYDELSRELKRLEVEVVGIRERLKASERLLDSPEADVRDAEARRALRAEIKQHWRALVEFERAIDDLRIKTVLLRASPAATRRTRQEDEAVRRDFRLAVNTARRQGAMQTNRPAALLRRVSAAEVQLDRFLTRIADAAAERSARLGDALDAQATSVAALRQTLNQRWHESNEVAAVAAARAYDRALASSTETLELAQSGLVEVAWRQREEHREMFEYLSRRNAERIRELQEDYRSIVAEVPLEDSKPLVSP